MRTKITLALLFLNVALFTFIFYVEPHFSTEDSFHGAGSRVLGPEAANIVALEIAGHSPQPIRIEKHGDIWLLSQPAGWPANSNAVNRILTELQTLKHDTSFLVSDLAKNGQTLADYGLDQPQLTVTFTSGTENIQAAKTYTLRIGASTRIGNRLYILSPDGQRIHVVDRSLLDSLTLPLDQLRDDTLFTIPVFEASALTLQTAGAPIRIHRDALNWSFESPFIARASKILTELTLNDLGTLHAQSFVSAQEADDHTGLATPALRITIDGNNRRETLVLGNAVAPATPVAAGSTPPAETPFYAKMDDKPAIFIVSFPNDLLDTLKNAQKSLRETHFFNIFESRDVTAITLRAPNFPELTLQRLESSTAGNKDNAAWQIVRRSDGAGPQTQSADSPVIQHLLENLSLLSAQKFVSDAPSAADLESWGFNRPEREITLAFASPGTRTAALNARPATLTLQLGLGTDAQTYARVSGSDSVYAVDSDILAAMSVVARTYRNRLLRELPAGAQITGLKLTRLADKAVLYEKSFTSSTDSSAKPDPWDAILAAEPADRRKALKTVLASLSTLRAKDFVLDEFPASVPVAGENRPWSYQLDASISLTAAASGAPATKTTTQLFFTERVGGGTQLVGSPDFGAVFEAEQPLLDALFILATPPPIPAVPAAEIPAAKTQPSN